MARGSRFGRAAAEEAWRSAEADVLFKLHAHGVRTPKPLLFFEGVLLMELVLDAEGNAAPRLIDAAIDAETAAALYRDLRAQAVRMLDADLIHGDLSPYNVLLAGAGRHRLSAGHRRGAQLAVGVLLQARPGERAPTLARLRPAARGVRRGRA
jgi:serine/threonine-protein kinase RIO1